MWHPTAHHRGKGISVTAASGWRVTVQTTTTPQNFIINTYGAVDLVVDWGDSSSNTYNGTGLRTHSYATPGTRTVTFASGTATRIALGGTGTTPLLLKAVVNAVPVSLGLTSGIDMFKGCTNCTSWAANFFDAASASLTNILSMFYGLTAFNENLNNWSTGNILDASFTFFGCSTYSQPMSNWFQTPKVVYLGSMFRGASAFNQNIDSWNVSQATNTSTMFFGCSAFDSELHWNVGNVVAATAMFYGCAAFRGIGLENWNTAKMNSMASFFYGALVFNRSITAWSLAACTDISNMFRNAAAYNQAMAWNTSNVAQMGGAFWGATAFAQNLSAWNTSKVTTFAYTFASSSANFSISGWDLSALTTMANIWTSGVLSQANYDALTAWCALWNFTHGGTPINVPVGVGTTKYSASVAAIRLNLIVNYGWSFVDGGQA